MPESGNQYVSLDDGSERGWCSSMMSHPRERGLFIGLLVMSVIAATLLGTTLYYKQQIVPDNPHVTTTTVIPSTSSTTSTPTTTSRSTSSTSTTTTTTTEGSTTSTTDHTSTETSSPTSTTEQPDFEADSFTSTQQPDIIRLWSSTPSAETTTSTDEQPTSDMHWSTHTSMEDKETVKPSSKHKHKSATPTVEEYTTEADQYYTTEADPYYTTEDQFADVLKKSSGRAKGHKSHPKSIETPFENSQEHNSVEKNQQVGDDYDFILAKPQRGKHYKGYRA